MREETAARRFMEYLVSPMSLNFRLLTCVNGLDSERFLYNSRDLNEQPLVYKSKIPDISVNCVNSRTVKNHSKVFDGAEQNGATTRRVSDLRSMNVRKFALINGYTTVSSAKSSGSR